MVKFHVQVETVEGKIVAHLVGRAPPDVLSQVGTDDLHNLTREPDTEEDDPGPDHVRYGAIGLGCVDEKAEDLRIREIQTDAGCHAEGEGIHATFVRPEISREQRKIVTEGDTFIGVALLGSGRMVRVDLLPPTYDLSCAGLDQMVLI